VLGMRISQPEVSPGGMIRTANWLSLQSRYLNQQTQADVGGKDTVWPASSLLFLIEGGPERSSSQSPDDTRFSADMLSLFCLKVHFIYLILV